MPMFIQGMEGMSRRMYDGGNNITTAGNVLGLPSYVIALNSNITYAAIGLGLAQIRFHHQFLLEHQSRQSASMMLECHHP